jgi:hypothetical protein
MEEPRLDTNVPTPTSPDPDPALSKIPLPIPWISTETVPDVPLVHRPPSQCR